MTGKPAAKFGGKLQAVGPVSFIALIILSCLVYALLSMAPHHGNKRKDTSRAATRKVLLIGLDGADWDLIDPWIENGDLPVIGRLKKGGAWGDLRTLRPLVSPLIWSSLATGTTPDVHGVTDFFSPVRDGEPLRPVTRFELRCPTLWDILSILDLEIAVLGWWATWPADCRLNGWMVTDRVGSFIPGVELSDGSTDTRAGLYHPQHEIARLAGSRIEPGDVGAADLDRFFPCGPEALKPDAPDHRPSHFRDTLASTLSYYRMARTILEKGQPDFTALYFAGTDTVSHLFGLEMGDIPGLAAPPDSNTHQFAVQRFYRLVDACIGDLLHLVSPETLILVVSDHGFYSGQDRPSTAPDDFHGTAASWHRPLGLILVSGPEIRRGRIEDDASVLDITPTILWRLTGRRVAELPGRVLHQLWRPSNESVREERLILSWDPPVPGSGPGDDPAADERDEMAARELIDRLQKLGYLENPPGESSPAAQAAINLAEYLAWSDRPDEAASVLERALIMHPDETRLLFRLAHNLAGQGKIREAFERVESALGEHAVPLPQSEIPFLADLYCRAGSFSRASRLVEAQSSRSPSDPHLELARAILEEWHGNRENAAARYFDLLRHSPGMQNAAQRLTNLAPRNDPRWTGLSTQLTKAAAIQTGNRSVQITTAIVLLHLGEPLRALPMLRQALRLDPDLVANRMLLGQTLYFLHRPAESFSVLAAGLTWHPDHPELLGAAGTAALRAGYIEQGIELLERASEAGLESPDLEAALIMAHTLLQTGH